MKKTFTVLSLTFAFLLIVSDCPAQSGVWEELKPTNSPLPRLAFGMAEIGDGKVLIFGGEDNTKKQDETWIYDYNENTWTQINNDIHPDKRYNLIMARITKNKVLMFGGWNPSGLIEAGYYNDTWLFDLETLQWTEVKPEIKPSPRRSFGLAQLMDGKVLLFGGDTVAANYANDTWLFDIDSNNWQRIPNGISTRPPECEAGMMAQIDTGKILYYGGFYSKRLDETWLFDYNVKKWIKIEPKLKSVPIAGSSMAGIRKNEVVFWGGDLDSYGHYDELWLFDLIDSSWKNIQTNIKPDGRYAHQIVNFDENMIFLFGGLNNQKNRWHNDTWLFTLKTDYVNDNVSGGKKKNNLYVTNNFIRLNVNYAGLVNYKIYDIYGRTVKESNKELIDEYFTINLSDLTNGLYFLNVQMNKKTEIFKLLIDK
ncbi:MAG: kelch repeat-containing protein [Bacteroidota bacterium]